MVSAKTCWQIVYNITDLQHQIVFSAFVDNDEETDRSESEDAHVMGRYSSHKRFLDMLVYNEDIEPEEILDRAVDYSEYDDSPLIPQWIDDIDGYSPNIRTDDGGCLIKTINKDEMVNL